MLKKNIYKFSFRFKIIKTFLFRTENNHLLDQTIEFQIAEQAALITSLSDVSLSQSCNHECLYHWTVLFKLFFFLVLGKYYWSMEYWSVNILLSFVGTFIFKVEGGRGGYGATCPYQRASNLQTTNAWFNLD